MGLGMRRAFIPKVYAGVKKKKHSKTKAQQAAIAIAKKKKGK